MIRLLPVVALTFFIALPATAQTNDSQSFVDSVFGRFGVNTPQPDGTYLGQRTDNPYLPDSITNPYGSYGSRYAPNSVNNPYGRYGSRFSPNSANNPYATNPPKLYAPNGKYLGTLSKNRFDPDSIANPFGRYGNRFSPDSVNNPYGRYGSPYTLTPPSIYSGDSR